MRPKNSLWLINSTHYLIMVRGFWKPHLLLFHQLPRRSFMVTVNQTFQVNTHLLGELLLVSIQVLFKNLQMWLSNALLLPSLQTKHPIFKYNKVIFLPFKVLFLPDTYVEDGVLMLRVKLSKYLTLSLADSDNICFSYLHCRHLKIYLISMAVSSNFFTVYHNSIKFCISPLNSEMCSTVVLYKNTAECFDWPADCQR